MLLKGKKKKASQEKEKRRSGSHRGSPGNWEVSSEGAGENLSLYSSRESAARETGDAEEKNGGKKHKGKTGSGAQGEQFLNAVS